MPFLPFSSSQDWWAALVLNVLAVLDLEIGKSDDLLTGEISMRLQAPSLTTIATSLVLLGFIFGYGAKYMIADVVEVILAHLP